MAHELEVWLFADRIGTLALIEGRLNFRYAAEWLKQPNAVALSCSLPLQAELFDDHKTRPFFSGLLPEGRMRRLLDYVAFNAQIGNHDVHAKNFSLLYAGKTPVLAPLYDTLSTAVYPDLTPKMAMKLGGKYTFSEVQARHWAQFFQAAGLSVAQARKRILEVSKQLSLAARKLQSAPDSGFAGHPLVTQVITLIEQRATLTIRRLTDPAADDGLSGD